MDVDELLRCERNGSYGALEDVGVLSALSCMHVVARARVVLLQRTLPSKTTGNYWRWKVSC